MIEGWLGDEYLVLFDEVEADAFAGAYSISEFLPGLVLVGLRGWDDFIVRNPACELFVVSTVPLTHSGMEPFDLPGNFRLTPDERFVGRVKWYIKPILFGGNPSDDENIAWVSLGQHAQLVTWWNRKYHQRTSPPPPQV